MRTTESRDAMVARVNEAFAKHRTLEDWPVATKWDIHAPVAAPHGEKEYIAALYHLCADGVPTGRLKDEPVLVGKREAA